MTNNLENYIDVRNKWIQKQMEQEKKIDCPIYDNENNLCGASGKECDVLNKRSCFMYDIFHIHSYDCFHNQ